MTKYYCHSCHRPFFAESSECPFCKDDNGDPYDEENEDDFAYYPEEYGLEQRLAYIDKRDSL